MFTVRYLVDDDNNRRADGSCDKKISRLFSEVINAMGLIGEWRRMGKYFKSFSLKNNKRNKIKKQKFKCCVT